MFPRVQTPPLVTAEEVERISLSGKQVELVRGKVVVREPPGTWHGIIAANLTYLLSDFVRRNDLGVIAGQDTGFQIGSDPDTVRAPDVAFISRERTAAIPRRGYAGFAPDLAAEVLSPGDSPAEVLAKVANWLGAGTRLVWVVDPVPPQVRVFRRDGSLSILDESESLAGEDVLPGLSLTVRELFAGVK